MKGKNLFLFAPIFLATRVMAHCPLCTIGAGAAAGAAVWLGVSKIVVALFIGAFSMSMGMWFAGVVKKKYIPFQNFVIVSLVFFTTLLPILPLFSAIGPLYFSFIGDYGTTFAVNYSLYTGLLGGLIILVSPSVSKEITKLRKGKHISFQTMILNFVILLAIGVAIQILV